MFNHFPGFQGILISLFNLLSVQVAWSQCAVDVTINEGAAVTFCDGSGQTVTASLGYVSYTWSGAGTGSSQSITPTTSGTYTVSATDGVGCVSSASIVVTIAPNPSPAINSSEGSTLCPGGPATVLSTATPYTNYIWSTGDVNPSITTATAGTFTVLVTDANGCQGTGFITLNQANFDLQAVGGNALCTGGSVTLLATGGDAYAWSTGEFGNSISVAPATPTVYSVTIFKGSCMATLSTTVDIVETPAYELPDTIYAPQTESVFVPGPQGFDFYSWSPVTNISSPNTSGVVHYPPTSEWLTVVAEIQGSCTITDSVFVKRVGLTVPGGLSPNGDGKNDKWIIPELDLIQGEVQVWNRWGDIVFETDYYLNDWEGTCEGPRCLGDKRLPDGTYYYKIVVKDIEFSGYLILKK